MTDEHTSRRPRRRVTPTVVVAAVVLAVGAIVALLYVRQAQTVQLIESRRAAAAQAEASSERIDELASQLQQTKSKLRRTRRQLRAVTKARDTARRAVEEANGAAASARAAAAAADSAMTSCEKMFAAGVAFPEAYNTWLVNGAPASWDADHDGIPCENSYGERTYAP